MDVRVPCGLQAATLVMFAYLCLGEFVPSPIASGSIVDSDWARQQVLLLAAISFLIVLVGSTRTGCSGRNCALDDTGGPSASYSFLAALNVVPLIVAIAATHWFKRSDNCPAAPYDGAPVETQAECGYPAIIIDVVGLISARLARFDLGLSLLLATRGDASWLLNATRGWLALPETVPLHRTAGWWCVGQSALHSIAYLSFYTWTGGLRSLWLNCFPAVIPACDGSDCRHHDGGLNTLGLVNFFGVVAFAAILPLSIPAVPCLRRSAYHVFQLLHVGTAVLFVLCCALHDLPILLFAIPGIADWYIGWRDTTAQRVVLPAKALQLSGTSGPWVELVIDCSGSEILQVDQNIALRRRALAPRGEWALVRVLPLGRERHPLSVAVSADSNTLSALVTAGAGDWSLELAKLSNATDRGSCLVEVTGPFPVGGGDWSLAEEPALLLVAGGTGLVGWLPALSTLTSSAERLVHLVWCVKTHSDYLSLRERLPAGMANTVRISVYITRHGATTAACDALDSSLQLADDDKGFDLSEECGHDTWMGASSTATRAGTVSSARIERSLRAWVSLFAAWTALAVVFGGWAYIKAQLGRPRSLIYYSAWWRALPIVLTLSSLIVTAAIGSYVCRVCLRRKPKYGRVQLRDRACIDQPSQALLSQAVDVEGIHETARGTQQTEGSPLFRSFDTDSATAHALQTGKPDLAALVRSVAACMLTQRERTRLVVAACGPVGLVKAVQHAVASVRSDGCPVNICFSGTDSTW
eukprot:COSAG02_NODE_3950_length_5995_cov_2.769674_2_plen_755_part_00